MLRVRFQGFLGDTEKCTMKQTDLASISAQAGEKDGVKVFKVARWRVKNEVSAA